MLVDEMLKLKRLGFSARQIAETLGVTRNSVIGKLWRAKNTGKWKEVKQPDPPASPPPPRVFRGSLADAFWELTHDTCRWPIGDPREPNFHFCCSPRLDCSAYCGAHDQIAFLRREK